MVESARSLLRVDKNASPDEVRKAYVRLVRRYPPEHFPEKFAELRNAYRKLTISNEFLEEIAQRIISKDSALDVAACLWGDYGELEYDSQFAPEELISLLEGEKTRRSLDELLASAPEIEWKTGGNV